MSEQIPEVFGVLVRLTDVHLSPYWFFAEDRRDAMVSADRINNEKRTATIHELVPAEQLDEALEALRQCVEELGRYQMHHATIGNGIELACAALDRSRDATT